MEIDMKKSFLISFAYYAVITCIIAVLCRFMLKYLLPFILAGVIAYLMQRPAGYIAKHTKIRSGIWAAILSVLFYAAVIIIFGFAVYRIGYYLAGIIEDVLKYIPDLNMYFEKFKNLKFLQFLTDNFGDIFQNMLNSIISALTGYISGFASFLAKSMPSFLFSCVVALVATCYIAKDYKSLAKFLRNLCGKKIYGNILKVKSVLVTSVFKLLKGYLILMLITYAVLLVGFTVLKVKYTALVAAVVALIDILPVLGTGTVLIPCALFEIIAGDIGKGIGFAVLYMITVLVRNFAEPRVIAGQLGINPLFLLLAMFVGIKLFGAAGLFLLPVTLIVVVKYYKNEMEYEDRLSE